MTAMVDNLLSDSFSSLITFHVPCSQRQPSTYEAKKARLEKEKQETRQKNHEQGLTWILNPTRPSSLETVGPYIGNPLSGQQKETAELSKNYSGR